MKQNTLFGGIVLILVLGGIIWYAATRPMSPGEPGTASSTSFSAQSPYTEQSDYYQIAANFPTTTPLSGAADVSALEAMHGWISDQVTQFKTEGNFDHLTPEDIQMMGYDQGRKQTLQVSYLIASSPIEQPRTVSYIYTEYLDTLGAHGNTFFKTFTFDTATGNLLALSDLFQSGSDYLGALSSAARTYLTENIGQNSTAQMIDDGTTPDPKNFQNWFLDNRDLVLLYAPYDVAPYAAGPQTVRLPLASLSGILKPAYLPH